MKRLLITTLILSIPLAVFAQSDRPVNTRIRRPIDRHVLEKVSEKTERPNLEDVRELKAKNPGEAFDFHHDLLAQRIERLQANTTIPDDKKQELIDNFTEEISWIEQKNAELEAAGTAEERISIRQEIVDHVHSVRTEQRQTLADSVKLPDQSPSQLAEQIGDRFSQIADHLTAAGKDTTELDTAIKDYQTAVTALNAAYTAVQTDKSVDTLAALRDSITAVRAAGSAVRNAVQSIV